MPLRWRPPERPPRFPSRVTLDRRRAMAAMALQRPPASAATTLHGPKAARSMALRRPLACPLRLRALLHQCRLVVAALALQRPLLSPLRLRAVLGRWRAVAVTALHRQPLRHRRPPSRPPLERWAAAEMAP